MQRRFNTALKGLVLALALTTAGGAVAQDFVFSWNPRTGDAWIDTRLTDINRYGYRYREPFIDELVRYYGAPRALVYDLIVNKRWAPGDVYYACAIAQATGRPCREIVTEWQRDHARGWGVIAQRMGIKPGSAEFQRLKRGFVPTYDRWGRPIMIDDDLRKAFPDRSDGDKSGNTQKADQAPGQAKAARIKSERAKPAKPAKSAAEGKVDHGKRGDKGNGKP